MCRERSAKPRRISKGLCATGRPICQVSSVPISPARSTIHSVIRRQISPRSASGTRFHAACAATARSSDFSIAASGASANSV